MWWVVEVDVEESTGSFPFLIYRKVYRGVEEMTSWAGRCDAISVDRRFIQVVDRGPERSHGPQLDARRTSVHPRMQ